MSDDPKANIEPDLDLEEDEEEPSLPLAVPYWRRVWVGLRRRLASAGPWLAGS